MFPKQVYYRYTTPRGEQRHSSRKAWINKDSFYINEIQKNKGKTEIINRYYYEKINNVDNYDVRNIEQFRIWLECTQTDGLIAWKPAAKAIQG